MRKIFTLLLLLIPLWMQAQDGYTWDENTKTLTIHTNRPYGDTYKTTAETLIIEGTYTTITGSAFKQYSALKKVIINDGVTSIKSYAFSGCTALEEITIPNNVTSIGSYVFSGCTSLKEITIPGSVTSIGHYAFNNCTALTNIVYEGTTKPTIGDYAFSGISAEATVTVPAVYEDDSFGGFSGDKLKKELYAISITTLTNGTLTATVDGKPAKYAKKDATITLTATPDEWYLFEEFTVTDAQDNPVAVTGNTFTMPASNVTVSASFKKQSYTLTINQPEGGSISAKVGDTEVTSSSQEVEFEKTVTHTATASEGYE